MKKRLALIAAVALALGLFAGPALAQTGDAELDGSEHPYVGALLAKRIADDSQVIICSGTLVAPRVFLTASHCTAFLESRGQHRAYVTFDPTFGTNSDHSITSTPYLGDVVTNPAFKAGGLQNDASYILLDKGVFDITPAVLAPIGLLENLRASGAIRSTKFLNVGYGSAEQLVVPRSGPTFPFDGIRKWTISGFHALDSRHLHLNQNLARNFSGTGYGDSGGPTFVEVDGGLVLVSVVSTGDTPAYATSVNQRVDLKGVQDFIPEAP